MDESTTITVLQVANPNDPADPTEKKLLLGFSSGETEPLLNYHELCTKIDELAAANANDTEIIHQRTLKRNLYIEAKTRCENDLNICPEEDED